MGGIFEIATSTVGFKVGLWGNPARHCNEVSGRKASYLEPLGPTFTAVIHASRSASEIDLHSRLTRGFAQELAYADVMNTRRKARSTCFARLTDIWKDR